MIYEYRCIGCKKYFEVSKPVSEYDTTETCPDCGDFGEKQFSANLYFNKAKVTHAEYNPGLGCVVKNERHKDYLMKSKGLVEIGNDFKAPDNVHKKMDQDREETRKKRWDTALED